MRSLAAASGTHLYEKLTVRSGESCTCRKLRASSYELQASSYELRAASYQLQVTVSSCNSQVAIGGEARHRHLFAREVLGEANALDGQRDLRRL